MTVQTARVVELDHFARKLAMATDTDATLPAQHRVHPPRDRPLPLLEHVPVGVRGQHDGRVAEQLFDVLEREALRKREGGGRMTEVMEPAGR